MGNWSFKKKRRRYRGNLYVYSHYTYPNVKFLPLTTHHPNVEMARVASGLELIR